MNYISRPAPFVLISSSHGTMIINRNDFRPGDGCGVGAQIMRNSCYDKEVIGLISALINNRFRFYGDGFVALDCGANIGVFAVEWAKLLHGRGSVIAIEAQEKIFYALAGNLIINNCLNATAKYAAVGSECGTINIPEPNYLIPSSFGSFELKQSEKTEYIGQKVDYDATTKKVELITIDSMNLERLDFVKIDVEGMEIEALKGAQQTLKKCKPQLVIEIIKSDKQEIEDFLQKQGYKTYDLGAMDIFAVHKEDKSGEKISVNGNSWSFA